MGNQRNLIEVGIIGCGPRGLSALESLFAEAAKRNQLIKAVVIERTSQSGAGPVYDINQGKTNWLNVAERAVDVWPRPESRLMDFSIPSFPDFQEWLGFSNDNRELSKADRFPPRSKMGQYLNERFKSIATILIERGLLTSVHGEVVSADKENGKVVLKLLGGDCYVVDEAVLTIGHQPVELDEQLFNWQSRVSELDFPSLFTQPYPLDSILESDTITNDKIVAIRGFGLAMIDLVRALSEGFGGKFQVSDELKREMKYIPSGKEPYSIIPFSLDGLPMAPKPVNKEIDAPFLPSELELQEYKSKVTSAISSEQQPETVDFLIDAIAPLIAKKYGSPMMNALEHNYTVEEIKGIAEEWLKDADFEHALIMPLNNPVVETMEGFADMATGFENASLDFCIGHVWRHCQPTMYKLLSFSSLSDEVIAKIVALDERLKRYSYGPPVDSIRQLLALEKADLLNLGFVDNPSIALHAGGWQLEYNGKSVVAHIMINSVLDAPQIEKVASPLAKGLINESKVEAVHDELGIRTREDAVIKFKNKDFDFPLAVLGRLAKGTIIGVDAIAECFGVRSQLWAEGVFDRMENTSVAE